MVDAIRNELDKQTLMRVFTRALVVEGILIEKVEKNKMFLNKILLY